MTEKRVKLFSLILALSVAVALTVGYVFSWLTDWKNGELTISGSSASAYFAGGDGLSASSPFLIANETHMSNLIVLQNAGKFVNSTTGKQESYYFALQNDITMSGYIPPIGNDKCPFIGDFDGKGYTIKGLQVTTDKDKLEESVYPLEAGKDYAFSQAVGLFGMTGKGSNVHNVILDNPYVEVASSTYSTSSSGQVVGLAIGYVAGGASSIGVLATDTSTETATATASSAAFSTVFDDSSSGSATTTTTALDIQVTGYSTFNSILGDLADGVESSVTGGGSTGSGGSGSSFGGSLNFLEMIERMYLMNYYGWDSPKLKVFGGLASDDSSQLEKYYYMSFVVSNDVSIEVGDKSSTDKNYYNVNKSETVPSTNIGYYIGSEAKIKPRSKSNNFTDTTVYTAAFDGSAVTKQEVTLTGNIKTNFDEMLSKDYLYGVRFNKQIDTNDWISITGANVAGYENITITVPINTVWFAAQNTGIARFIFSSESNASLDRGIGIYLITRTNTATDNPYYSALTNPKNVQSDGNTVWGSGYQYGNMDSSAVSVTNISKAYKNTFSDGSITYTYGAGDTNATKYEQIYDYDWYNSNILSANGLFYTEFPLIKGYEYALGAPNESNTWIMYMDIGSSAADEETDTSTVDATKNVSAVDFIYEGVEIAKSASDDGKIAVGDFVIQGSLYNASKTSVYFSNLNYVLKIVYIRLNGDTSNGHSGKTICLEKSADEDEKCTLTGVVASYPDYVCPTVAQGSGSSSSSGTNTGETGGETGETTVAVTGVTLDQTELSLTAGGGTATLTATISPSNATNSAVTWSSDNESVATVDSAGNVTAVAAGTATITVTADGGFTATCKVTVAGVTLDADTYSSGATLFTLTDGNGTSIATVKANCDFEKKTSGAGGYQATNDSASLTLELAAGYTYTIKMTLGSSGDGTRSIGFNNSSGDNVLINATTGTSSSFVECEWTYKATGTVTLTSNEKNKIRISSITIIAVPITSS